MRSSAAPASLSNDQRMSTGSSATNICTPLGIIAPLQVHALPRRATRRRSRAKVRCALLTPPPPRRQGLPSRRHAPEKRPVPCGLTSAPPAPYQLDLLAPPLAAAPTPS